VMTRLHIQMNQTIQFYRGQQGGSTPLRLYLAGGASVMAYASQFFAEKLNVPVDYLNPFVNIELDEELDLEALSSVAHTMGEVVGLGIRSLAQCPVNMNLMPKSHQSRVAFQQKKPYFILAVISMVMVVFAWGWFFDRTRAARAAQLAEINKDLAPLKQKSQALASAKKALDDNLAQAKEHFGTLDNRMYWGRFCIELRKTLIEFEKNNTLGDDVPAGHAGVWVHEMTPQYSALKPKTTAKKTPRQSRFSNRQAGAGAEKMRDPSIVHYVDVTFMAVNLVKRAPDANIKFAFALKEELGKNPLFVAKYTTQQEGISQPAEEDLTFSFTIRVNLRNPITVY